MIGLTKNIICMTLPTIGETSRNRAQNEPSNNVTAKAFTSQIAIAGIVSSSDQPGHI